MPREIAHWKVLDQVTSELKKDGDRELYNLITNNRAAAFLGAMGPDAPYYHRAGRSKFEAVAEFLHGSNREDTFDSVREIATALVYETSKTNRDIGWAFLLGFVSHLLTDAIFHPMVYFFTGDYYHVDPIKRSGARVRHRIFEVYLDSWTFFKIPSPLWNHGQMKDVSAELGSKNLRIISQILGSTLVILENFPLLKEGTKQHEIFWFDAFRHMVIFQRLLIAPSAGCVVNLLNKLFGQRLCETEALVSYGRQTPEEIFDKPLSYKNPVSGELRKKTILELMDEATNTCREVFITFLPLIKGETKDVKAVLGDIKGLSLNFGLYKVGSEDASYYSETGFDLPGLKI